MTRRDMKKRIKREGSHILLTMLAALVSVVACLIFGVTSFKAFIYSIDFNVVLMLVGIMVTVYLFTESLMPKKLADKLIAKMPNSLTAIILLTTLSGLVSAFVDNVATVLMLAPIGIAVAKKINVSPVPVIIAIAVSSNLQGAATLVGDTTSVMLGSFASMGFLEFFVLENRISIFFVVEISALATIPISAFLFRKDRKKLNISFENVKVKSIYPTVLLLINILLLACASFIPLRLVVFGQDITNGFICAVIAIIGLIIFLEKKSGTLKGVFKNAIDYQTVLFLVFLFILVGTVEQVGVIKDISQLFIGLGTKSVFLLYTVIVFGSVIISAFIDNIPYVATMLPVIKSLTLGLPGVSPYLFYFGLLCGATLGGNITPFGASANVVGIGILNKEGYKVKNKDFFKIGIPFTLAAVLISYILVWVIWA
jgi:Na+/H+ antiporter NhaD/arsenite permease-like protein